MSIRRPQKALTAQAVKSAKAPGKYFDGHGLYLRVDKNGSRFWVQRITIRGKRREMGLGSPDLVSLATVRAQAIENHAAAREGRDPIQERREARAVMTFEEAAERVFELNKPTWKNAKHADQFINTLRTYAFPVFGRTRATDVSSADLLSALTPIWLEKPETARRVKQRINTVMQWCIVQGWREDNPAATVASALPKQKTKKAHRKALPYNKVQDFLTVLWASGAGVSTKLALEFLILNASRSGEVRLARWEEVDFDAKVWNIPEERMKMDRPHRVPLSDRSIEILKQARGLDDVLIFPGSRVGKPMSDMTLSKLVKELGFPVDVHGFRTSFRTWTQEQTNFPNEICEAALAHLSGDAVERAYARSDLFEKRRRMMAAWAGYLAESQKKIVRIG